MGSPIAWAMLSLLTIFSTVFAIYTWIAGKKRKQLSISCRTNEIIIAGKSNIDKLQIRYDGQDIADLSYTKFYIWNSGNTVLNTSDIVSSRPICIKNTGSAEILSAEIVRVSDETNSFTIKSATEQSVEVSFDYVDHGDGFVMQILHSGDSKDLEVDCKIKGGKGIRERSSMNRKQREARIDILWDTLGALTPSLLGYPLFLVSCNLGAHVVNNVNINAWIRIPSAVLIVVGLPVLGFFAGTRIAEGINKKYHRSIPRTLLGE